MADDNSGILSILVEILGQKQVAHHRNVTVLKFCSFQVLDILNDEYNKQMYHLFLALYTYLDNSLI